MKRCGALAAMFLVACSPSVAPAPRANATCASCHPTQSSAFASTPHARADATDLFRALHARLDDGTRAFCDRCHAPHVVADERGVGCVTCHQAIGTRGVSNGRLVPADDAVMRGPFDAPMPTSGHESQRSPFVTSAELCGTCHEVEGPGAFVETPFSEWSRSPAAARGVTCADCHMSATPGATADRPSAPAAVGGPPRPLSDHAFVGPDDARAPELLARAAAIDVSVRARFGDALTVDVAITNRNPGHALPSGARFAREVWVELSARDDRGATHVVSGDLDARGAPVSDPQRVDLGDLATRDGMHALPFAATQHVVRAIPASERRVFTFTVPVAFDGASTAAVSARLRFRRNDWALRALLDLPMNRDAPIDLAHAEVAVP